MKILLTGNRGFVGQHLQPALEKAGHDVIGYSLSDGQDVRDQNKLDTLFEQESFDVVIHMAALAGVRRSEQYPEDYISTNVMGTLNIVRACERNDVKRLINFSSASVYGGASGKIKEMFETEPASIYGMTKLMAEKIVARAKIQTVTVRPFTLYGEGGRKDQVMFKWIEHIKQGRSIPVYADNLGDAAELVRGFTYVGDFVEAIIKLVTANLNQHSLFNLGGNDLVSLADLIAIFGQAHGFDKKIDFVGRQIGDVDSSIADITWAMEVIGWQPRTNFAKKLTEIIKHEMRGIKL